MKVKREVPSPEIDYNIQQFYRKEKLRFYAATATGLLIGVAMLAIMAAVLSWL